MEQADFRYAGKNSIHPQFEFDMITYHKYMQNHPPNKYTYDDIIIYIEKKIWPSYCKLQENKEEFCDEIKNFYLDDGKLYHRNIGPDLEYVSVMVVNDISTQFEIMKQFHCAFHVPNQEHKSFVELHNVLLSKYYWFNMAEDIRNFIFCCKTCNSYYIDSSMSGRINDNKTTDMDRFQIVSSSNVDKLNSDYHNNYSKNTTCTGINKRIPTNDYHNMCTTLFKDQNITSTLDNNSTGFGYQPNNFPRITTNPLHFPVGLPPSINNNNSSNNCFINTLPPRFQVTSQRPTIIKNPIIPLSNSSLYHPLSLHSIQNQKSSNMVKTNKQSSKKIDRNSMDIIRSKNNTKIIHHSSNTHPTIGHPTITTTNGQNYQTTLSDRSIKNISSSTNTNTTTTAATTTATTTTTTTTITNTTTTTTNRNHHPSLNDYNIQTVIDSINASSENFESSFNEMLAMVEDMEGDMIGAMAGSQSSYSRINSCMKQLLNIQLPSCLKYVIETLENSSNNNGTVTSSTTTPKTLVNLHSSSKHL